MVSSFHSSLQFPETAKLTPPFMTSSYRCRGLCGCACACACSCSSSILLVLFVVIIMHLVNLNSSHSSCSSHCRSSGSSHSFPSSTSPSSTSPSSPSPSSPLFYCYCCCCGWLLVVVCVYLHSFVHSSVRTCACLQMEWPPGTLSADSRTLTIRIGFLACWSCVEQVPASSDVEAVM